MIKKITIALFIICLSQSVLAQGDHLSLGIGPALLYSDNSGIYREFKFKVQPAITLSINKQLNEYIGLRGSVGLQLLNSGQYYLELPKQMVKWGNKDQAFAFKGQGYFADVMPVFTTNPNSAGMMMSSLQFYAGAGFGVMYAQRNQEVLKNGLVLNDLLEEGEIIKSKESDLIPYVPVRTGISTNLNGDWDFALEFVLLVTTNSEVDGNNIIDKRITVVDMSGQIQFTVKWYFGPAW
tara:strand:- start:549 stop:1259 length:711 start_codon:yes stop_codon:yes gene_type:complete